MSGGRLRAHVAATDAATRAEVVAALLRADVDPVDDPGPDTVVVAAGPTVDAAVAACPPARRDDGHRLLVIAERFTQAGVLRAARIGVGAMLRPADATPHQLRAALHAARHGDGRMPSEVLVRLLGGAGAEPEPPPRPSPLTGRQTAVLRLMAEGHANAVIARSLSCSEHTVKNVIYEMMTRLRVRNRAHAVAHAVRSGLI